MLKYCIIFLKKKKKKKVSALVFSIDLEIHVKLIFLPIKNTGIHAISDRTHFMHRHSCV